MNITKTHNNYSIMKAVTDHNIATEVHPIPNNACLDQKWLTSYQTGRPRSGTNKTIGGSDGVGPNTFSSGRADHAKPNLGESV